MVKPVETLNAMPSQGLSQEIPAVSSQKTEKAARDFEALLLQNMMKSMWSTVDSKKSLFGSRDEETYRDMLNQSLATTIANGEGIGIRDVVLKDMKVLEKYGK